MRLRAVLLGLAALGALGVVALASSRSAQAIDAEEGAAQLLALTNISRSSNGLPALPRDPRLNQVAAARSEDMIRRDYFSHQIPPSNLTVVDLLEALGVRMRSAGENIAWNNALDFTTIQVASEDFMNSPEHRANVLNPRWDRVGTGVAQGGGKRMYAVLFLQSSAEAGLATPDATEAQLETPPGLEDAPLEARQIEVSVAREGLIDGVVNRVLALVLGL